MKNDESRWLEVLPGWTTGRRPRRQVSVERSDASTMIVTLTYEIGGLWLYPREDGSETSKEHIVRIPDGRVTATPAEPMVPVDSFPMALPHKATLDPQEIRWEVLESKEIRGRYKIPPALPLQLEEEYVEAQPNPEIYASDAWYPEFVARCGSPSTVDGLRRVFVSVYPVAYAPRSGRLRLRNRIDVWLFCRVPAESRYDRNGVDWDSPLVKTTIGSQFYLPLR